MQDHGLSFYKWTEWAGEQLRGLHRHPHKRKLIGVIASGVEALEPGSLDDVASPLHGYSFEPLRRDRIFRVARQAVEDMVFFGIEQLHAADPDATLTIAGDLAYRLKGTLGARLKLFLIDEFSDHPRLPLKLLKENRVQLAAQVAGLETQTWQGDAQKAGGACQQAMLKTFEAA